MLPLGEIEGRIDQSGLVHNQLQTWASPTLVTGMAMLVAQMQSLTTRPDLVLSISVGIDSFRRTVELHKGGWRGNDLTHHFDDHRSHQTFGEPARPAMEQHRPLLFLLARNQQDTPHVPQGTQLTTSAQQITCILPRRPPAVLTPPLSTAPISVRFIPSLNTNLMLPFSFRGKGKGCR